MQKDKLKIVRIINEGLQSADLGMDMPVITVDDLNLATYWDERGLINFSDVSTMRRIFDKISRNRIRDFGQFHHFKGVKYAKQIIQEKSIQISDLFSNDANDFAEYTEFYKRLGLFHLLIPTDYADQKKTGNGTVDWTSPTPSDLDRKRIFVLCFTQDNHNERFWANYAKDDTGVALGFRFSNFNQDKSGLYDFRDVFYDKGYAFDFYNQINYRLKKEFKRQMFITDVVMFSKFYKRGHYNWENETRLCFDYDEVPILNKGVLLSELFPMSTDESSGRNYINLPLKGSETINPLFDLEITELVCGSKVSEQDYQDLKSLLNVNFPDAKIWRRV
ncbi:Protein of unknown function [Pedobacter sp. ok626]|uniref:DUF2971 domain-containing protein n=1 Tax=Pedobacter sp. ok626 TaxID=1761882 RepID=UPI0008890428|nr:DUF2971 domain-containing protein [Pedobacter sp. ok626]SDJ48075.1 Protein of unknown function [Pedobacter sp. ok626]